MRTLIAVFLITICTTVLGISEENKSQEFKIPNKFKSDEPIEAEKFNQNFEKIEIEITALKESLKDTQDSLTRLQSFDSQLKKVQKNVIPQKTVAAFALSECPTGWSDFDEGAGRVILGVGKGTKLTERILMVKGGEEKHKLTIGEMPYHKHKWNGVRADRKDDYGFDGSERNVHRASDSVVNDISEAQGGNQPHNNMPPFVTLRFCQKD